MNGSKDCTIDDMFGSEELKHWPSNTAMLSKYLAPMVETLTQDHQGKTDVFNFSAMIPEMESTEFPIQTDSTIDHDCSEVGQHDARL